MGRAGSPRGMPGGGAGSGVRTQQQPMQHQAGVQSFPACNEDKFSGSHQSSCPTLRPDLRMVVLQCVREVACVLRRVYTRRRYSGCSRLSAHGTATPHGPAPLMADVTGRSAHTTRLHGTPLRGLHQQCNPLLRCSPFMHHRCWPLGMRAQASMQQPGVHVPPPLLPPTLLSMLLPSRVATPPYLAPLPLPLDDTTLLGPVIR